MATDGVAQRCDADFYAVGAGESRPGWTKDNYADAIFEFILKANQGGYVLPAAGQRGNWLNKFFLKSATGAGKESWKHFKAKYRTRIEFDADEEWVRCQPERHLSDS